MAVTLSASAKALRRRGRELALEGVWPCPRLEFESIILRIPAKARSKWSFSSSASLGVPTPSRQAILCLAG